MIRTDRGRPEPPLRAFRVWAARDTLGRMARKPPTCGVALPRRPFPALPPPAPRKAPVRRPGARPAPAARAKAPVAVPVRPRAPLGLPAPAAAPSRSMLPPFPGARARGPRAHLGGVPRDERPQEPGAPRRRGQHTGGRPSYGTPSMALAADAWSTARPGDVVTWTPTDPGVLAAGGVPITGALVSIDPRRPRVVKLRVHGGITVTRSEMQGRLDFAGASAPAVPMYAAPAAPILLEAPAVQAYHVEQSQGVVLEPLPAPAAPMPRKKATRQPRAKKSGPSEATLPEALPVAVPEAPIVPDPPKPEPIVASASSPVGAVLLPDAEDSTSRKVADAEGKWSPYQRAVFRAIEQGSGHLVIEAVAGSGKSTTILEAIRRIPKNLSVLLVAFNKSIQKELQTKIPPEHTNVTVSTLAAHGFAVLRRYWPGCTLVHESRPWGDLCQKVRDFKVYQAGMAGIYLGGGSPGMTLGEFEKLLPLCESYLAMTDDAIRAVREDYGLLISKDGGARAWTYTGERGRVFRDDDVNSWVRASMQYRLMQPFGPYYGSDVIFGNNPRKPGINSSFLFQHARGMNPRAAEASMQKAYESLTRDGTLTSISFRDMSFVPAATPIMVPEVLYDVIFVDETQDMDVSQLTLVQKSLAPGGRIVVVGDRRQSIYRFRGADSQAIPRLISELKATVLPLSVSYRVPECAADAARVVVPTFETPPGTPVGTCAKIKAGQMTQMWRQGDVVITRVNEPLVPMAMLAISQGITPWILGEGNAVQNEIKRIMRDLRSANPTNERVDVFIEGVQNWFSDRVASHVERLRKLIGRKDADDERRAAYRPYGKSGGGKGRWTRRNGEDESADDALLNLQMESDAEIVSLRLVRDAFIGIARRPGIASVRDIEDVVGNLAASDKQVESMTPEEYRALMLSRLVLTSVHRIKGGEANRVFILTETFTFAFGGFQKKLRTDREADAREEENLWYVAVTRPKNEPDQAVLAATGSFAAALQAGRPGELYYVSGMEGLLGKSKNDAYKADDDTGKPTRPNGARRRLKAAAPVRKRRRR